MKVMRQILLIMSLSFIVVAFSYSQEEQQILSNSLQNYKNELPKLQKAAFKELKRLDKDYNKHSSEYNNYRYVIIPTFKLKAEFVQYHVGDLFVKYIDFKEMWYSYEAFIFKDTTYTGYLYFDKYGSFYFSINDTSKYNHPAFKDQCNLAKQIMSFKPDMVFYPDCPMFLCFIKEGKLYIGKGVKQQQPLESILPAEEFIKKNPSFIKELQDNKNPALKRYKELQ